MKRSEHFPQQLLRHGAGEPFGSAAEEPSEGRRRAGASGDRTPSARGLGFLAGLGATFIVLSCLLPVYWRCVAPVVVEAAGRESSNLIELGMSQVTGEEPGPLALILAAAQMLDVRGAKDLGTAYEKLKARRPELVRWGGRDPVIEPLLDSNPAPAGPAKPPVSEPALQLFLGESARARLREHLRVSRSPGVETILNSRELTNTTHFVPAMRPGGQPFEATILLAGLLYEGERLSPALAQEFRSVAEKANKRGDATEWENLCLDLLTLGKRLDWKQLAELLRVVPNARTLHQLAELVRTVPEYLPIVYSACLLTQSAEGVANYLDRFGTKGRADLGRALASGDGAVRLLTGRQLPIGPAMAWALGFAAPWIVREPGWALAAKLFGFALAALCFYLVWNRLSAVERVEGISERSGALRWRRVAVTLSLVLLLGLASEPLLLPQRGPPRSRMRLVLPALAKSPAPTIENTERKATTMNLDTSTIVSVAIFAALQIIVYAICLTKIREINAHRCAPQLKLKLMENEENLFDGGLYVGIAGTALALVLQVLGFIEANLLAAYSSNLFGILCVAFVKIRHVRAFKKKLILQSQATVAKPEPVAEALA